ncbi:hypothetical protein E4U41_000591 [Claviceps citrina]|nr:hypothetical protein E4U41_000591 [Claviceps citrina]
MQPIPVETWLDQVQESIRQDDVAEATDPGRSVSVLGESLPTTQVDEGETRLATAHRRDSGLTTASIPRQIQSEHAGDVRSAAGATPVVNDCGSSGRPVEYVGEFVRKPRRKTRQDRYDTRHDDKSASGRLHSHHRNDDGPRRAGRKARRKSGLRSGKEVMTNFASESIFRDNLIMKPCVTGTHPCEDARTREKRAMADLLSHDFDLGSDGIRRAHLRTTCSDLKNGLHHARRPEPGLPTMPKEQTSITCFLDRLDPREGKPARVEIPGGTAFVQTNASTCRSDFHHHSSLGRIHAHVHPMSQQVSPRLENWSRYPYPIARPELHSQNEAHSHLGPLAQKMTRHNADGKRDFPGLDALHPATSQPQDTASMDRLGLCIDLGGGHTLDFGRLRNRSLYRADRVPLPGDNTMANWASPLQHKRDMPSTKIERQVISARRRARNLHDDPLKRRFSCSLAR